jgi:hypothetical protein
LGGERLDNLKQPNAADMPGARRKQKARFFRNERKPCANGLPRTPPNEEVFDRSFLPPRAERASKL